MKNTKVTKAKASDMFFLAVLAYLSLLVEKIFHSIIIDILYEPIALGDLGWTLVLRLLCCAVWGCVVFSVLRLSRTHGFDTLREYGKPGLKNWLFPLIAFAAFIAFWAIVDGGFSFVDTFAGASNLLLPITGYVFYAFEGAVLVSVIVLAQKGGELVFRKDLIPYGGILLGFMWFVMHLVTGGDLLGSLAMLGVGVYFGIIYLLSGKRLVPAAVSIILSFILM